MLGRLQWTPTLNRINVQQTPHKIEKAATVSHFGLLLLDRHVTGPDGIVEDDFIQIGGTEILLGRRLYPIRVLNVRKYDEMGLPNHISRVT
jgi:hypothetical protein